jgi:DNA invertase Pin-like site-specific DNA recombinase
MVHKYIETRPDLKQPKPKTTPLTSAQQSRIIQLRDAGMEFNAIAATLDCTFAQAYKYYNKNKK